MREILFRGKMNNGSWAYGNLEVKTGGICIITPDDTPIGSYGQIIAETVGQYTGKEVEGGRLFEGDIVETVEDYDDGFGYPATSYFYSVVIWDKENFCWAFNTDGCIQGFNDWNWDCTRKVGNIHDNPELLKKEM